MGCGCKKKKKPVVGEQTSTIVKEQKDYRERVREAMKEFMAMKKRKQNLKS